MAPALILSALTRSQLKTSSAGWREEDRDGETEWCDLYACLPLLS
jgi:hypothetical protein